MTRPATSQTRKLPRKPAKVIRARGGWRWSKKAEENFLATLAATANVSTAAYESGFSRPTVYKRRIDYPAFAVKWEVALATAYARLEALLVENATNVLEGAQFDPDRPIPRMTVAEAINLLARHRAAAREGAHARSWRFKPADPEAARAEILRKVAAVRGARGRA